MRQPAAFRLTPVKESGEILGVMLLLVSPRRLSEKGRCFKPVDYLSEGKAKFIAIHELNGRIPIFPVDL
jgi:hypothetical protein